MWKYQMWNYKDLHNLNVKILFNVTLKFDSPAIVNANLTDHTGSYCMPLFFIPWTLLYKNIIIHTIWQWMNSFFLNGFIFVNSVITQNERVDISVKLT